MSSIKKELNKLAEKVGAPVNGKNISEQIASINVHLEGTSHGANISERINEFREAWGGGDNPPILKNKTITENGVYNAVDDQADGYKKVDVDLPLPTLLDKTITENGTYNASSDEADGYKEVVVNVPNTYVAADEGKVVRNAALKSQTAYPSTIRENGTYTTTNNNSVTVDVQPTLTTKNITANGTYNASTDSADGYSSVTVNVAGAETSNDVIFYDYDGTILHSYSASDFVNLSAMPSNPMHTGLTAQGWNWTLADAKAYVAAYGKLNIGQMYNTSDGKTRYGIALENDSESFTLPLYIYGTASIDWGDGSSVETVTDTQPDHTYSNGGKYEITIALITDDSVSVSSGSRIIYVRIGDGIDHIGDNAFSDCSALASITIPNSVTSIGDNAFSSCSALTSITIPNNVTSIGDNAFSSCSALTSITIPNSADHIGGYAFYDCSALASITIPNSVTSIGDSAFYDCYALTSITILNSVTSIGDSAFYDCYALTSITIPNSVTSIGYSAFSSCSALASITIPNSVTSIGDSAFYDCSALASITIPNSVTSIGSYAFSDCSALTYVKFIPLQPPSINEDTFNTVMSIIYIPLGTYDDYTTADNYPASPIIDYVEYATYTSGVTLPTTSQDQTRTYTWYATIEDWLAKTNPISVGNGNEIYCRSAAVS